MLIIAVTGLRGAGKSLVKDVGEELGIPSFEMSDTVLQMMKATGNYDMDIRDFARLIREKEGLNVFARHIIQKVLKSGHDRVIVSGVRGMYEIDTFKKYGKTFIIAIIADAKLRFERTIARERVHDPKTLEEFIKADEKDMGFGVGEVIEHADYVIENNGTINDAKDKIRSILKSIA